MLGAIHRAESLRKRGREVRMESGRVDGVVVKQPADFLPVLEHGERPLVEAGSVAVEMRMALRHLQLGMPEEAPDHREILAQSERTGRESMAEMVAGVVIGVARTAVTRAQECRFRRSG